MTEPSEDLPSAKLFLGRSVCDGCGMVAEGGPEQNLALHLVLFASGNEWTGGRDEERGREREREEHYGKILGFRAEAHWRKSF